MGKSVKKKAVKKRATKKAQVIKYEPVLINYGRSATVNMGNFESDKVQVSITLPSGIAPQCLTKTYNKARKFVDEKINKEVAELRNPTAATDPEPVEGPPNESGGRTLIYE